MMLRKPVRTCRMDNTADSDVSLEDWRVRDKDIFEKQLTQVYMCMENEYKSRKRTEQSAEKLFENASPPYLDKDVSELAAKYINDLKLAECSKSPINFSDVMKVGGAVEMNNQKEIYRDGVHIDNQASLRWLKRVLMLNQQTRDVDVPKVVDHCTDHATGPDESDEFFDDDDDVEINSTSRLNPMDYLALVYGSCDTNVKQLVMKSLFMCRCALPLVIPNFQSNQYELSILALQKINLECTRKNEKHHDSSAIETSCDVLSMIKLGNVERVSKSNVLNHFLDPPTGHGSFLHFNCDNGSVNRILTKGMVELSWFVPGRNYREHDITALLNLRGDAVLYKPQLQLMAQLSDAFICLLESKNLQDPKILETIQHIPKTIPIIFIVVQSTNENTNDINIKCRNLLTGRSKDNTNRIIYSTTDMNIKSLVEKVKIRTTKSHLPSANLQPNEQIRDHFPLQLLSTTTPTWRKDLTEHSLEAFLADTVTADVRKVSTGNPQVQRDLFPLQGDLWREWTRLYKDGYETATNDEQEQTDDDASDEDDSSDSLSIIESQQTKVLESQTSSVVTKCLSILNQGDISASQFLAFLGNSFNKICRENLPDLRDEWHKLWSKQQSLSDTCSKEEKDEIVRELNQVETKLKQSSIGLEHLFREFSQMYEVDYRRSGPSTYSMLPDLVASLIVDGYPLEVLDGDAGNIALTWLKAVVDSIINRIGNANVVIVSVLGVQSSGKSTLLNTMFGVQFPVSAGRCTKGAFLQLVKADENEPFQYVLVLDTEGLKSAELDQAESRTRDNEIATFVIGIGDIIIVNIRGENYAEMAEVLQIAVHAFLRMKMVYENVKLKKRCLFVHQNSPSANAKVHNEIARRKLQETLDDMTEEAARQENFSGFRYFNQLISFDCMEDVVYFPDLWEGTPPMGYISPAYSQEAAKTRLQIVSYISRLGQYRSMKSLSASIKDIWESIMSENFIFQFRNCLVARFYRDINALASLSLSDLKIRSNESMQKACANMEGHDTHQIEQKLDSDFISLKTDAIDKFNSDGQNLIVHRLECTEILRTELSYLERKIDNFHDTLKLKIKGLISNHMKTSEISMQINSTKKEIGRKIRILAEENKALLQDDEMLESKFEEEWQNIYSDEEQNDSQPICHLQADSIVSTDLITLLKQLFKAHENELETILRLKNNYIGNSRATESPLKLGDFQEGSIDVSELSKTQTRYSSEETEWQACCKPTLLYVIKQTDDHLTNALDFFKNEQVEYNDLLLVHLLIDLQQLFSKKRAIELEQKTVSVTIRPLLHVKIAVFVCRRFKETLVRMYMKQHERSEGLDQVEKCKDTFRDLFFKLVKGVRNYNILENNISKGLRTVFKFNVVNLMKEWMSDQLQSKLQYSKKVLLVELYMHLADKNDTDSFYEFLKDPKIAAANYLRSTIDECIFKGKLQEIVDNLFRDKTELWYDVTCKQFTGEQFNAADWAKTFWRTVENDGLSLPKGDIDVLPDGLSVEKHSRFRDDILGMLDKTINAASELAFSSMLSILTERSFMYQVLHKIWGCPIYCPFCKEPCYKQSCSETHECLMHRPEATTSALIEKNGKPRKRTCSFNVTTLFETYVYDDTKHRYRKYKNDFPDWHISKTKAKCDSTYWQWVLFNHSNSLAEKFGCKPLTPDKSWHKLSSKLAKQYIEQFKEK